MSEFVTVLITGKETVRFNQKVKMPRSDFETLNKMLSSDDGRERYKAEKVISDLWINKSDFDSDDDSFDLDVFELENSSAPTQKSPARRHYRRVRVD